jgi:hypothetical protein
MNEEWAITIIDPFDCTYNPARQIKIKKEIFKDQVDLK